MTDLVPYEEPRKVLEGEVVCIDGCNLPFGHEGAHKYVIKFDSATGSREAYGIYQINPLWQSNWGAVSVEHAPPPTDEDVQTAANYLRDGTEE